jgi:alpha-glucosidase
MYFHKVESPLNFVFAGTEDKKLTAGGKLIRRTIEQKGESVIYVKYDAAGWKKNPSQAEIDLSELSKSNPLFGFEESQDGGFSLLWQDKKVFSTKKDEAFGLCGNKWLLNFASLDEASIYGMGEKNLPFERSGLKTNFWNTDVFADFPFGQIENYPTDPMYASFPYILIRLEEMWLGVLLDNPYRVFMNMGAAEAIEQFKGIESDKNFYIGAEQGPAEFYFIAGQNPQEVNSQLQRIVGTTALPPLWALGHHQSRWGYEGPEDLARLQEEFKKRNIPNHGLWLDIDYMDHYRVFSLSKEKFDSHGMKTLASLRESGMKIVTILDPGVKEDDPLHRDNSQLFCKNPAGTSFVGYVWPGASVFPDFSLEETRDFWAAKVVELSKLGFDAYWLDMNDPSTGSSNFEDMLFEQGSSGHSSFHNQYGLLMQKASRKGLETAEPLKRPFLLSRSGFLGSSKYSALWCGDSISNYFHLRKSISMMLSLSISSLPFVGADVGGFAGDCDGELLLAWYRSAFLTPFFRNHSARGSKDQEPWQFGRKIEAGIRQAIVLRYSLLPYIYQLFVQQEQRGIPMMRPLFYDSPWTSELEKIDDQFMIGPGIMQAPILDENVQERELYLPQGYWFSLFENSWMEGGRKIIAKQKPTPMYMKDGAIIPRQKEVTAPYTDINLHEVDIHLFPGPQAYQETMFKYQADAGEGFEYREGKKTEIFIRLVKEGQRVHVEFRTIENGDGPINLRFFVYGNYESVLVTTVEGSRVHDLTLTKSDWLGENIPVYLSSEMRIS